LASTTARENDGDVGKHEVIQMVAQGSAPTIASGQVGIWNEGGILKTRAGAGAVTDLGLEAGTRMVFYQASAPTGWTAVGSLNDRVLRVNNSTAGNTSGSWTVSGFTVAGHSLTTAQLPAHNHTASTNNTGSHNHGGTNSSGTLNTNSSGTLTTNSGGVHSHSGSANSGGQPPPPADRWRFEWRLELKGVILYQPARVDGLCWRSHPLAEHQQFVLAYPYHQRPYPFYQRPYPHHQ
jgi:hypothetical protein